MATILHKRKTADPSASDLTVGELAINTQDGGVFTKTTGGSVVEIGSTGGSADNTSTFTTTENNSTDETVYPVFVDGTSGNQGAEVDTGLTYNPSTGVLTTTSVTGNLTGNVTGNTSGTAATVTGAAQSAITSVGTLTGLTVAGDVTFDNGTNAGKDLTWDESDNALEFADDTKATFGTDADLQIYHNGTDGFIDNNTRHLYIRCNVDDDDGGNIYLQGKSGEQGIKINDDGAVELYHDNSKKFETIATGAVVTGNLGVSDSSPSKPLTVGTSTPAILLDDQSSRTVELVGGSTSTNPTLQTTYAASLYFGTNSTARYYINGDGHFIPNANDTYDLGSNSNKFKNIHTNAATITGLMSATTIDGAAGDNLSLDFGSIA